MINIIDLSFRIPALSPNNEMLVGILANGDLVADEAAGAGNSFRPEEVVAQCQIRGGAGLAAIQDALDELYQEIGYSSIYAFQCRGDRSALR